MNDQANPPDISLSSLQAMMAEQMRWSGLELTLDELAEDIPGLLADLSRFEPSSSVALLASLLADPAYQSTTLRLELLIAFALLHSRGAVRPTRDDAARWFAEIGNSRVASGEDPAEDVFVTLVTTDREQFRVLEGLWESAGFYTQCVVDLVEQMPDSGIYRQLKAEVRALLTVGELVCEKAGLVRYQTGSDLIPDELDLSSLPHHDELRERVTIPLNELSARGVLPAHLDAFTFALGSVDALAGQVPGLSDLDRQPLLIADGSVIVALPTALSTALRDHVIDFVVATSQVDLFNAHYAHILTGKIADVRLFGSRSGCRIHWHRAGPDRFASAILEFDRGYYIVLHFALPSIEVHERGRFKAPITVSDKLAQALDHAIATTAAQVEAAPTFRAGLHLIVMCGWGQGMLLPVARHGDPRWREESVSVADLIRLSGVDSMSVERFWRLEAAVHALPDAGVEILNVNGVLNLLGWVELNGGHLVPHDDLGDGRISVEHPLILNPPLNLLRDLRAQADQSTDLHVGSDAKGETHRLQRVNTKPYFPNPSDARVYACIDCASGRELITVCEGRPTVWLRVEAPHLSSDVQYRLWEAVSGWVGRIVHVLEEVGSSANTFELVYRFEDKQADVDATEAAPLSHPELLLRHEVTTPSSAVVSAKAGFMRAFRDPSNSAERALVEETLKAVLTLGRGSNPDLAVSTLMPLVVKNDTGRHFHVMHAHDFSDYVRSSVPSKVLEIDDIDSARLRLGLGWSVYDGPNAIDGAEACRKLLNKLVDARVEHVIAQLRDLDRAYLVQRLLLNHEAGHAQEMRWRRTSAAVLGLHGDSPATRTTVVEQLSKAAGAQISSRVLIEMALCATPLETGRLPADIEIQSLLAEIALLIRLGGLSDGIYYGALEPRMRISPLGDILVRDAFGSEVVEPMLSAAMGDRYVRSAASHRRHYEAPQTLDRSEHLLEPEFVKAWNVEMGFSVDEGRRMLDALESTAIGQQTAVMSMPRSRLVALLEAVAHTDKVEKFIERFSLCPRSEWDRAPAGFKMREILPWRFGRRLSVATRPLLQLSSADDPAYMVSPTLMRSGFFYVLNGAHAGTLDQEFFNSTEMRDAWWGRANEGHTFNAAVADQLRAAGWSTEDNIELPAILKLKLDRDYGDVDVLAWRPDSDEVLIIECKDLTFRRNYSEIAALLSDYQGELKGGKPDKLRRHLNRVDRLRQGIAAVAQYTGIQSPQLMSCMVVGGLVPMQFASIPALQQTFVGDTDALLAKFGSEPRD